ncbi:MAG: glycosyltransferase family 2 protein [Pyrinomonadaceae bacterium]
MSDLVSIIMPAYNAEKHIAESIQSAINQTYQNWELIVVDDGSTDGTAEIARGFSDRDKRVKYFFQKNSRLGKARNTGIKNSCGDLIAFLDSDDLWVKEKLELQVKTVHETRVDLVFSDGFIFVEDDVTDENVTFQTLRGRFDGGGLSDLLLVGNYLPVLSVLARKDSLNEVGRFEEAPLYHGCEDYDLWLKLARHGAAFYGMKELLVRYRRHSGAMTHKDSKMLKPMLQVVKRYIYDSSLDKNKVKERMRNLYRDLIRALIEEGEIIEARAYMKEFSAWDKSGLVTSLQKVLIKVLPNKYNFISKECLYRTEWHIKKSLGKLIIL